MAWPFVTDLRRRPLRSPADEAVYDPLIALSRYPTTRTLSGPWQQGCSGFPLQQITARRGPTATSTSNVCCPCRDSRLSSPTTSLTPSTASQISLPSSPHHSGTAAWSTNLHFSWRIQSWHRACLHYLRCDFNSVRYCRCGANSLDSTSPTASCLAHHRREMVAIWS